MFGRQQSTEVAFVFPTQLSLGLNMTVESAVVIVSALRKGKSGLIQLMYIFLSDLPSSSTFQQQIKLRPTLFLKQTSLKKSLRKLFLCSINCRSHSKLKST